MHKDTQPIDREDLPDPLKPTKSFVSMRTRWRALLPPALRSETACWFSAEITF